MLNAEKCTMVGLPFWGNHLTMTHVKLLVHQKTCAIVWGDMDALGHVNHARYFDYFQQARIEWLETLQLDLKQAYGPVIVHTACTFFKPVVYPALISIDSSIHNPGRSSLVVEHDLYQDGVLMAHGICKIVWVDYQKNKAVALPDKIRALYSPTTLAR